MIKKILIANRGEIAVRIIKTCKKLNIKTVAVYSDIDKNNLFVELADESYSLDGLTAQETYLNINKILNIAKLSNTDAIHPGYGFLSENATFADMVNKSGIKFIGPTSQSILAMGLKSTAKKLMAQANVNILPGYNGDDQSEDILLAQAEIIGYPILIKAAAGGGGKGMRIVYKATDLITAVHSAKREAKKSFANDNIILEKYLANPRHVEVQIIADQYNNYLYLFERDCSLQRRYQKVIEEAPAPNISDLLRKSLGEQAVMAAKAVDYIGAGTIEFLLDGDIDHGKFYFMEMNTRLQVEHPVTEMISGLDLVELQINIANGEKLKIQQSDLKINGHAIEARLYAEDVDNNFLPAIGKISYLEFPGYHPNLENCPPGLEPGSMSNPAQIPAQGRDDRFVKDQTRAQTRIDTGVKQNDKISIYYDPMLAKIISWGETRESAINNLVNILLNTYLIGVKNNIGFLLNCLNSKSFRSADLSTSFIDNNLNLLTNFAKPDDIYFILASLYINFCSNFENNNFNNKLVTESESESKYVFIDPWDRLHNFRTCLPSIAIYDITSCFGGNEILEKKVNLKFNNNSPRSLCHPSLESRFDFDIRANINNTNYHINKIYIKNINNAVNISCDYKSDILGQNINMKTISARIINTDHKLYIFDNLNGQRSVFNNQASHGEDDQEIHIGALIAPMPGTIIAVNVSTGSKVKSGDPLVILEAMKMEHTIYAQKAGVVKNILYQQGQQVAMGAELLLME